VKAVCGAMPRAAGCGVMPQDGNGMVISVMKTSAISRAGRSGRQDGVGMGAARASSTISDAAKASSTASLLGAAMASSSG
jgi:hypothetical protein